MYFTTWNYFTGFHPCITVIRSRQTDCPPTLVSMSAFCIACMAYIPQLLEKLCHFYEFLHQYWRKTGLITLIADTIPCLFKASYCTIGLIIYYFVASYPLCKTRYEKNPLWGSGANGYKDISEHWPAERQLKIYPSHPYIIRVNTLVNTESQILTSASWFYRYTNTYENMVLSAQSISDKWKGENSVWYWQRKERQARKNVNMFLGTCSFEIWVKK